MQQAIRFTEHAEDYLGAARRLAEQARLSLGAPPTVGDVVTELRAFALAQHDMGSWPAVGEVEDSVLGPSPVKVGTRLLITRRA